MAVKKRERPEKNAMRHSRNLRRQEEKRDRANELIAKRSKLTASQQMERLDWRCGLGEGAKKERTRLAQQMQ